MRMPFNNLYLSSWKNRVILASIALLSFFIVLSVLWNMYDIFQVIKLVHAEVHLNNKSLQAPTIISAAQLHPSDIFGENQKESTRVNTSLKLEGVLLANDNKDSSAIISSQNTESQIYKVGDDISSGLKLERVYHDRVVLNRSGILETLYLDWSVGAPSVAPSENATPEAAIENANLENVKEIQEKIQMLPQFKGFNLKSIINNRKWGKE